MKKLLLGLMLVAVPLVGCGAGTEDASSDTVQTVTTESGQSINLDYGPMSSEEPLASMHDSSGDVSAMGAGCWVTLLYCKDPRYNGWATCQQNGKCSYQQFKDNCIALYNKTC
ncbi:hypothetical protein D187_003647 [Cystobacter fuscus DSM 2262]|uniref:Lipoprotein n=1 Tax=Cystobacter fuscus (strain ATCC 25194 / DSM 2262 / NBRC 100088 / M29) TaxID=1242864 RepID=S9P9H6_CYSF2|nr:hypothetical protein [Cystobacter fuscus]EPX58932.1 hypothetical protein D187_003647 [Cystobacter fuscus DSM 2262]